MQKEKSLLFTFKKFQLLHGGASFRVGTDSVILGAWASQNFNPKLLIDIGTGSGIIALMLAQRFPDSKIHALEISNEASIQAGLNFKNSSFSDQFININMDINKYTPKAKYDLMVSNPPYFNDGIKPKSEVLLRSKHDSQMELNHLFSFAHKYLNTNGLLEIIYPSSQLAEIIQDAYKFELYPLRKLHIHPKPGSTPVRSIITFSNSNASKCEEHFITLEKSLRHEYHEDYKKLCRDFYLKF